MKKILLVPALLAVFLVSCGEEGSSYGTNPLGPGSGGTTKTQKNNTEGTIVVDGDSVRYTQPL